MENYDHWRNYMDNEHLRAESFAPKEKRVLTIKAAKKEEVTSSNGEKEHKLVLYFVEPVLPMVINVTNAKVVERLYGTGNPQLWIGKKIQVFATKTKVAKEMVPCLRIEEVIPTSNEVQYLCSVCGKTISKDTYDKSIAKYGKPYCSKECLDKDTKGEQLL